MCLVAEKSPGKLDPTKKFLSLLFPRPCSMFFWNLGNVGLLCSTMLVHACREFYCFFFFELIIL